MRGTLKVCAVKSPEFGDRKKLVLEDIAALTGGQVFTKEKGMKLEKFSWEWFGEARVATIGKDKTTLVDGKGKNKKYRAKSRRISPNKSIEQKVLLKWKDYKIEWSKFVGGVAIVHVGGNTELEMS